MASIIKEFQHLKIQLEEIKNTTNSFRNKIIGKGGFGAVYKGELSHSKGRSVVAIKRLDRQFGQGDPEFLKEIVMLSRYTHQHLISLLGYCDEAGEKILVYEYASNGSLDNHLSDPSMSWTQRLNICIGAAKGLSYLHDPHGTYQRVLHCDIKSANILLDENLNAKVADFGLAKLCPANQQYSVLVTNARGTAGYCDPLYMMSYTLTKESDIYSFGVVLFEVLCGKLCVEINKGQLSVFVPIWKQNYIEKKLEKIIFQDLIQQIDQTSLETFSEIAFQCLQVNREERPTMSLVVEKLELALEAQELHDLKLIEEEYVEILKAAPPLRYRSVKELNLLLSNGVFLNAGKTWFSRNDEGEHYVLISIAECLIPFEDADESLIYSSECNSRFEVGCYSTYGKKFKLHMRSHFLSPQIPYAVNLVFKYRGGKETTKLKYLPLKYTLEGETKVSMVYIAEKREDEGLIARLNRFISKTRMIDLEFWFEDHKYCNSLEIEGIELKPLENVERHEMLEYKEIFKNEVPRSVEELKASTSKEVYLNKDKTTADVIKSQTKTDSVKQNEEPLKETTHNSDDNNNSYASNDEFAKGGLGTNVLDLSYLEAHTDDNNSYDVSNDALAYDGSESDLIDFSLSIANNEPKHWSFFTNLGEDAFSQKDIASLIDQDHLAFLSTLPTIEEASGSELDLEDSFIDYEEEEEEDTTFVQGSESVSRYNPLPLEVGESKQFADMVENMRMAYSEYETEIRNAGLPSSGLSLEDIDISSLQIIMNEDLIELRELGSGTFGKVYLGKWRGTDVAIKRINKSCFEGQSSEQERLKIEFWRDASILSKLHHPNIVAFYGVVQDGPDETFATVTEYMVNGSLRHVLVRNDRMLDRRKRLLIAMDAAFGMEYLHSKDIVHFNLKCDKLLLNIKDPSRPICKVGDFGLSKIKQNTFVSGGVRETLPWMAPELLNRSDSKISEKVDVFSFGIVLWEIFTGEEPYTNMHDGAIIEGIVSNTLRPPIPSYCDGEWRKLMEHCWAPNPMDRPSFTEITRQLQDLYQDGMRPQYWR